MQQLFRIAWTQHEETLASVSTEINQANHMLSASSAATSILYLVVFLLAQLLLTEAGDRVRSARQPSELARHGLAGQARGQSPLSRRSPQPLRSQLPGAAQPKDGIEIPNWNSAPSRNLSLSMTVSGRRQDCFTSLFTDSRKIAQSLGYMENHGRTHSAYEDYQKSASSAIGNLKIAEVDPGGHFVKILNCAPKKEENIGDYLLKQDIQGQPVAVFRFPPETRMGPNSTVTVWAADATVLHKPPSDFLWKDLERFRTSLDCATILCEPSGQAVAWYTPLYWNRRQGWVAKEQTENIENVHYEKVWFIGVAVDSLVCAPRSQSGMRAIDCFE
ncbi:PREDICTED: lamin tail domain-containing protein 1 [Nipponia nippon]|uniref:lamin tail domain-containing protein 1 n=1 Tax=Nipponia nippon TaxID=128390 RepID=UPI00051196A7|nr:PREDICTED: lamin tail domain-containing protein 1 [Nipponia nippon]